jgi:tetratricopeptide (TPR) repeat protein
MFMKQVVGFAVLLVFLVVLGAVKGGLESIGAPGFVSWPLGVIVGLAVVVGLPMAWTQVRGRMLLAKPGVRAWNDLDNRAFELQKKGDLAAAAELFAQAIPLADQTNDRRVIATAANNLAAVDFDLRRYADARDLFQKAYEIRKQTFGAADPATLTTAERLSACAAELGQWSDVEALQRDLLTLYTKKSGAKSPATTDTMNLIAVACRHQGKFAEAARLYQEEEVVLRRAGRLDTESAGSLYNDWAYLLVASGTPLAALPLYEKAIAIRRRAGGAVAMATSIDNKADAQTAAGDADGAAATSQQWLGVMDGFLNSEGMSDQARAALAPLLEQHAKRLDAASRGAEATAARDRAAEIRRRYPEQAAEVDHEMARIAETEVPAAIDN